MWVRLCERAHLSALWEPAHSIQLNSIRLSMKLWFLDTFGFSRTMPLQAVIWYGRILSLLWLGGVQIQSKEYGGAYLLIEWIYRNPGSLLEDGRICDRLGNPHCDVFFTLCLRNAAEKRTRRDAEQCLLHQSTTQYYDNVEYLEFRDGNAVRVFIPNPVPVLYTFEISISDIDLLHRTQPIGSFIAEGFYLSNNGITTSVPMRRKNQQYSNIRLELRVMMTLKCVDNFYGEHCTKECVPNTAVYKCDDDGNRVCMPGYFGELCDKEDSCLYEPCAEHATCVNKADGHGRICQCNGNEGPECYPGYDPCSSAPCQHGGECQRMGQYNESFDCICAGVWTGYRCTDRRLACTEELERLNLEANNTNGAISVCLNGGECLEYTDQLAFRCVCEEGWTGARCEESQTETRQTGMLSLILTTFIGAVLLILTVVLIAIFIWRYRTSRRRAKMLEKHGGIVYFHANSTSSGTMNSLMGSPGLFVNQIYGTGTEAQPVIVVGSNVGNKKNLHDVYDECDPLGLSMKNNVYGTAFGADVPSSPDGRMTITTRSSLHSTNAEHEAPPLPERPKNLSLGLSRHSSICFTESGRDSGTAYSVDGSTINLIHNSGERKKPTVYRPISPITYMPSTFVPKSAPLPPPPTDV